ncbi:MAG: 3-isopropylmalate dehydratase [Candidatus Aminicenantes bacterium]|nr:3-isopropylmalate dehydratase [Candidatus Aminicenantes bacterium]
MTDFKVKGKVWLITDINGELINDIDTDQIFHNAFLHITEISEMGEHTFGNLEGWENFPEKCNPGDIVFAGSNFGAGSSRQQAVDCFEALGIKAIVAESYGAIYKRNAVNSGFPILIFKQINNFVKDGAIKNLDEIEIDFLAGELKNASSGKIFKIDPFSKVQKDIMEKGSLLTI